MKKYNITYLQEQYSTINIESLKELPFVNISANNCDLNINLCGGI